LARSKPAGATLKGVEDAILDVRVFSECQKQFAFVDQKRIVDENSNCDTSIRCPDDMVQHHRACRVEEPKKRLEIDAVRCAIDRPQSPVKRRGAIVKQDMPVLGCRGLDSIPDFGVCWRSGVLRHLLERLERSAPCSK
jgi:hypothetical protein